AFFAERAAHRLDTAFPCPGVRPGPQFLALGASRLGSLPWVRPGPVPCPGCAPAPASARSPADEGAEVRHLEPGYLEGAVDGGSDLREERGRVRRREVGL